MLAVESGTTWLTQKKFRRYTLKLTRDETSERKKIYLPTPPPPPTPPWELRINLKPIEQLSPPKITYDKKVVLYIHLEKFFVNDKKRFFGC